MSDDHSRKQLECNEEYCLYTGSQLTTRSSRQNGTASPELTRNDSKDSGRPQAAVQDREPIVRITRLAESNAQDSTPVVTRVTELSLQQRTTEKTEEMSATESGAIHSAKHALLDQPVKAPANSAETDGNGDNDAVFSVTASISRRGGIVAEEGQQNQGTPCGQHPKLPVYTVHLQGRATGALWDTGATRGFIHPQLVSGLNLQPDKTEPPLRVTCANGLVMKGRQHCEEVPVRMGSWQGKITLLLANVGQRLLIGFDFIYEAGTVWDVKEGRMQFGKNVEDVQDTARLFASAPKALTTVPTEGQKALTWTRTNAEQRSIR